MSLFLIDGHALAYRSYYAFANQPLVNSRGEETSAVYGFLNTILALIHKYDPDYLCVAFDAAGPTFRHERFEAYKANREAMPESLASQLPLIHAVLDAMGVTHVSVPGFEADDVIATLARRWEQRVPVEIVSGDKDLFQLIDDRVHVIRPGKGSVLEKELGPDGLVEKTGLRPDQFVDYLALMGDSSDNVPGVRGIGRKTARKLLDEYGSLDAIYDAIDSVEPPGVQKKLRAGRQDAMVSRELVTLRDDAPLDVALDDVRRNDHRTESFKELLLELEFERMAEQVFRDRGKAVPPALPAATDAGGKGAAERFYELVNDDAALGALAKRLESVREFAVDVETSSLDPMGAVLAGISIAVEPGRAWYVPVTSEIAPPGETPGLLPSERAPGLDIEVVRDALGGVFAAEEPAKIGQNIKYDAIVLERAGLPLGGIEFDTMLASYCLDPSRRSHSLDALAKEMFGHEMIPFADLFQTRSRVKDIRSVPLDRVSDYACEDADYTLRLKHAFAPMLEASPVASLFADVEMPLRDVLQRMEMTGVRVDGAFLGEMAARYAEEIGRLEERIYESVGERFNINSTQKLREVLFGRLGLKPARRTKTGYSTDSDVLARLADEHEVVAMLLDYRQKVKLKGTYIDALPRLVNPDTGRVHTSYNQAVASTGRLSSSDPNLQNIPIRTSEGREIRRAFVPAGKGWTFLDADYSQIELRILAHLSGDPELRQAFLDDDDIHRRTAARILGVEPSEVSDETRSRAKAVNFGIVYGMGARGLANSLDIPVDEAKRFIEEYFRSYPGVKRFIDDTVARARETMSVGTMLGRLRALPDISSSNQGARAFSERIAVNTPVQGSAADIIKLAMLEIDREISANGLASRMILQVHDELLFEVRDDEMDQMKALVKECMESAVALDVPLKVDMGTGANWLEAH